MDHHSYSTDPRTFYIEPAYQSPHGVYAFSEAGCDPLTITDSDAGLTVAYLEWFKVSRTSHAFVQACVQAGNFFKRNQGSMLALLRHLKTWRKMNGFSAADIAQATGGLISARQLNKAEQRNHLGVIEPDTIPNILLALADLYHIFPPLLFVWMGVPIPWSDLKQKTGNPVASSDLTLEEATHLTIYYSEAAVLDNIRPEIYSKLDPSKTLERFERQLQACVLNQAHTLPFVEAKEVCVERVLQKVRFKFKYESRQLWFPFNTRPIKDRVKRALTRQPTTCYVFFSAEDHVRALEEKDGDDGFSLPADLMDAYNLSAFEARVLWHKVSLLDQTTIKLEHKPAASRYLELIEDFFCQVPRHYISEATLDLIEFNAFNVVSVEYAQRVDILNFLDSLNRENVEDFNFQLACRLVSILLASVPVYQLMYLTNFFNNEDWDWWSGIALRDQADDDILLYMASVFSVLTREGKNAFWHVMRTVYLERRDTGEREGDPILANVVSLRQTTFPSEFICPFCRHDLAEYKQTIKREMTEDGFVKKIHITCPFCQKESRVINFLRPQMGWTWRLIDPNPVEPPVILTFKAGLDTKVHALAGPQQAFEFLQQFVEDVSNDKSRKRWGFFPFSLEGLIVWASDNEVRYCPGWHHPWYYDPDLPRIIMPDNSSLDDLLSAILSSPD